MKPVLKPSKFDEVQYSMPSVEEFRVKLAEKRPFSSDLFAEAEGYMENFLLWAYNFPKFLHVAVEF